MTTVLDASALLAHLFEEAGAETVGESLDRGAIISAVNWAEVLGRLADFGSDPHAVTAEMGARGLFVTLEVVPFESQDALQVAELRRLTTRAGLSLGDRACLSLALRLGVPVITADLAWEAIDLGVEIRQIR